MIIPPRFNGPPHSANGGYACGLISEALGGGFEVLLRRPPPLGVELDLVGHELKQGDVVIAEARRAAPFAFEAPAPVSVEEAEEAAGARLPVALDPRRAVPPRTAAPGAAGAFDAQLLGQDGQKRGLRGGPAVIDTAAASYNRTEWSGSKDRRARKGGGPDE